MSYARERQAAVDAVKAAAVLCTAVRREMAEIVSIVKEDSSPVTIADFGSQALVCRLLRAAFPDDVIVAEEDSHDLQSPGREKELAAVAQYIRRQHPDATPEEICRWIDAGGGAVAERYWVLDPIDGTKGFLRNDQYAVALALVEGGVVKVGALACPALPANADAVDGDKGVLFIAVRGEGTTTEPLQGGASAVARVRQGGDPSTIRFAESVESDHGNHALQEAIAKVAGVTAAPLRMDSQAKYGAIARGDAVLYLRLPSPKRPDYREAIWDHAAGALIVEEAGGTVTDMHGRPLDFAKGARMSDNRGVVVSNGLLHARVLEALDLATP